MNREKSILYKVKEESTEYLKSVSAFDLMKDSMSLQKDIRKTIGQYKLPVSVIAGVLTSEIHRIFREVDDALMSDAFTKVLRVSDKVTMDTIQRVKQYVDKNFMKKERP